MTAMTNNSGADRATVRMTPCLLADCTVLNVKSIVAHRSMVDLPCCHIAVHKPIAKWALVNKTVPATTPYITDKNDPMVDLPCLHIAVHKSTAKWALVNKTFPCDNAFLYRKFVPTDTPLDRPS